MMHHLNPGEQLANAARQAVDTALVDAKAQRVGATPVAAPPSAPEPAATPSGGPGAFA